MNIKLKLSVYLLLILGSAQAVPALSADRELSVINELSKLELELDARITYEAKKSSDVNLDSILLLEHELIVSSIYESNPNLLSKLLQLKYLDLSGETERSVVKTKKPDSVKVKSESKKKEGLVARNQKESDPPELISISVDKVTVDVTEGSQTLTFTVDATDDSGVNWSAGVNNTGMVLQDPGGGYHYAPGNSDDPGKLSVTISSDDKGGNWNFAFLALTDNLGNKSLFSTSVLRSFGLPNSIEVIGGVESDPPALNAISVDKVTVDVTEGSQTLTFTVDATDDSGVNWSAGVNNTGMVLQDPGGGYHYAPGNSDDPGKLSVTISSDDKGGNWNFAFLALTDNLGNKRLFSKSAVEEYGIPGFIYVLAGGQSTSDIALNADTSITNVSENSEINYSLIVENLAGAPTGQLTFELKSANVRVSAVSQAGSSACNISSINYNSTVSCALSGVDANTSKTLSLTLAPGISGTASFNANIVANIPDISYLNNYVSVSLVVDPDADGDGIADNADNCPNHSNFDQLDTDSDRNGNACDVDDDNDTVLDVNDAFPLDATETIDTDSDGIGDNADTDDDNDGITDSNDAFPLDSSESSDSDGDGLGDNGDAFPNDASETLDSDSDGIGDNSDVFPNNALYKADSDSDGMPDAWEIRYGLNPNDASDAASDQDNDGVAAIDEFLAGTIPAGSLDIDGNGQYDALTDGLLLLRGMFLLSGDSLISDAVASDAVYKTSDEVASRIEMLGDLVDIDGNGTVDALTDGLVILRYLFNLRGDVLINDVVASDATVTAAEDVEAKIEQLIPSL